MAHANYHATINCGNAQVMTPQPGTDLMPIDIATASPDVEAFYSRAARQQVTWLDTVECGNSNRVHTAQTYRGEAWSGYQIGGGAASAQHYVQAAWYAPTVTLPTTPYSNNGKYASGIWVGMGGGFNSNTSTALPLIQAGSAHDIGNPSGYGDNYFWYEVVTSATNPEAAKPILSISINPGDEIGAVVFWVPESKTAVLGICSWNKNRCISFNVGGISEPANTTEWVVEAPLINQIRAPLPAFSSVTFFSTCSAATTTYSVSSKPGVLYNYGDGSNGITGSTIGACQPAGADPSLAALNMYLAPQFMATTPFIAVPTPMGSDGATFQVNYIQP